MSAVEPGYGGQAAGDGPGASAGWMVAAVLVVGAGASFAAASVGAPLVPVVVLAAGIGLACLYLRPATGLALLVAVVFTNAAAIAETRFGLPVFNQLLVPVLILVIVLRALLRREVARDLPIVAAIFAAYLAATAVSVFYAREPEVATEELVLLAKDLVVGLVIVALMATASRFRVLCWTVILSAGALSVLGVVQTLLGDFGSDFGGFAKATVQHIAGRVDSWRISGPLTDPNFFAQVLLFALPLAIDRLLHGARTVDRLAGLAASVVIALAIALTYSRGGLIGMAVVIVAMVWLEGRRKAAAVALVAVMIGATAVTLLPGEFFDRVGAATGAVRTMLDGQAGAGGDEAISGRLSEMLVAVHLFLERPLIGVGYGQFEAFYQDTAMVHGLMARGADREAHSLFLQVLAERGLVGAVPFGLLIWLAFRSAFRASRHFAEAGRPGDAAMARAVAVGLAGYLSAAMFLHDDYQRYFWLAIAVALALPQATASEGLPLLRILSRAKTDRRSKPEVLR